VKSVGKFLYLIILSAALLLGAVGVAVIGHIEPPHLFSTEVVRPEFLVADSNGSHRERVTIYDAGDGNCYVFLPSYAQLDRVTVTAGKGQTFALDGVALSEGLNCGSFCPETPYAFTADGESLGNLWFYRSENVAAMYIDTVSGSMDEVHHYTYSYPEEFASARLYTADGKLDYLDDYAAIRGRGYSSWGIDKKSYTLSLDKSTGLLDMGNSEKWTLTSNGFDPTHLRNQIAYSFAEKIAPHPGWVPDCAFTELYLNGDYAGLYLLCQKPDAGPDHMNLAPEDFYFETFPTGRELEGPAIFEFCVAAAAEIKFPKECAEDQLALMQARVEELHEVLISEEETPWQDYIDLDSWVRKYLVEEVFMNLDGGRSSTYFYYDASVEKFYTGHCWDYDRTLAGLGGNMWNAPCSMLVKRDWKKGTSWFGALYRKEAFLDTVKEYYGQEFRPLLLDYADETIDVFAEQIRGAVRSEYLRSPELHEHQEWESAVEGIRTFLEKRIGFLDALWLENEVYYEIEGGIEHGNIYVAAGMPPEELPPNTYNPEGIWYLEGTDTPFDVTQPVTGNIRLSPLPASETPPPTEEVDEEVETVPKSGFATQDYITFASIAFLGLLLVCFVCVDIFRRRKDEQKAEQSFSHSGAGER